ncbi:MAG: hypothetical protein RLZZ261_475, partial [Bacteroidota bacterium]
PGSEHAALLPGPLECRIGVGTRKSSIHERNLYPCAVKSSVVQGIYLDLVDLLGRGAVLVALYALFAFPWRNFRSTRCLCEASLHEPHGPGGAHPRQRFKFPQLSFVCLNYHGAQPTASPNGFCDPSYRGHGIRLQGKVGASQRNTLSTPSLKGILSQHGCGEIHLGFVEKNPVLSGCILGPRNT